MKITEEQKKLMGKYISNLEELIKSEDVDEILDLLDDAMLNSLDKDDERTDETREIIKVFDSFYANN